MLNSVKKIVLASSIALTPLVLSANFIEGSSESISAAIEDPSFEKQIVRINTGINFVRINSDMLQNMPVSADSEWVDKVNADVNTKVVESMDAVKNDVYYSTVRITDAILGKSVSVRMSPLNYRLYWEASIIYKNPTNGNKDYSIPDMNVFPSITDIDTFISFKAAMKAAKKEDTKIALIDVEAKKSNLFDNAEDATISLLPDTMVESVNSAKDEYKEALRVTSKQKSKVEELKAWLDDDANENSPERANKKSALEAQKASLDEKKDIADKKQETYFALLEKGADAVKANFDPSKVALAKKLHSLFHAIDGNAFSAESMFAAGTAGLVRGYGAIKAEMDAINKAQMLSDLVGNQKEFIGERKKRMLIGALYAIPNIAIGGYYAAHQSSTVGKYQDIVNAVLDGDKAAKEAAKASK